MSSRKKIAFVIPALRYGGAELFLYRLCSKMRNQYEILLIVIGREEGLYEDFRKLNIKIYCLGFTHVRSFVSAWFEIRRIIKFEQPKVVHSFLYMADILAGLSVINLRVEKLIWSLRGTNLATGTTYYKRLIQRTARYLSNRMPTLIVACSKQVMEYHASIGYSTENMLCIENMLPEWTHPKLKSSIFLKEQNPTQFTIGLAARFEPGKGHLELVRGVSKFLTKHDNVDVRLRFAGKGCNPNGEFMECLGRLEEIREQLSQNRLVFEFSGLVRHDLMRSWYESIDLYYMASDSLEGFPNSLAEAIALGVPSLANPVGAAIDFLPKWRVANGFESAAIVNQIERFYYEPLVSRRSVTYDQSTKMIERCGDSRVYEEFRRIW